MIPNKTQMTDELKKFKESIKFIDLDPPEEIELLLSMTRDEMKIKDKEEISIDAARLAQYSLYLTIQANKLRSNIAWCDANIDSIVGRELGNTEGYGVKEKSLKIIRGDSFANELVGLKTTYEVQLQTINDLDRKVEFYASTIKNLCFVKG